mmetsp:Transcript_13485/g.20202  ORF Transcript_13485/g.20202 Transcript_13485/m.20202 type:complete len:120 (-) Transcript_13485:73-432(-)
MIWYQRMMMHLHIVLWIALLRKMTFIKPLTPFEEGQKLAIAWTMSRVKMTDKKAVGEGFVHNFDSVYEVGRKKLQVRNFLYQSIARSLFLFHLKSSDGRGGCVCWCWIGLVLVVLVVST